MKILLLQSSEPMPVVNPDLRLFRTGMLAEELSNNGHEVLWICNSFEHYTKKQMVKKDTNITIKDNYKLFLPYAIGYKKNISISRIINHYIITKKAKRKYRSIEKPDLIYASFPIIGYAYEAVKKKKKNNIPVIIDIRDLWPDIFKHNLPKIISIFASPFIKLMDKKTKYIMKNCFAINGTSNDIVNWGLNKAKREKNKYDRYFYIGYPENYEKVKKHTKLIDKNKFNISFFATINNQFNYDLIYELANALYNKDKNVIINICGDGPQFEIMKSKLSNLKNINILGWLSKEKLKEVLNNSDIGLAPYKNTFDFQMSVSNKFVEYISYGLPVIITCDGNMGKILSDNKCGFGSLDIKKICKYILDLKSDKKLYNDSSKNAKELFGKEFVATKVYREMRNYIEKIGDEVK